MTEFPLVPSFLHLFIYLQKKRYFVGNQETLAPIAERVALADGLLVVLDL